MNSRLLIEIDREVRINRILQWRTYDGLLEGLPTARLNNNILSSTLAEARKFCGYDEIFLIEPGLTPIHYEGRYPFGEPVSLPPITCIIEVNHFEACRDDSKDYSALGIVWFQNEYAFPIEAAILEKIKQIPFSKLCAEFNY